MNQVLQADGAVKYLLHYQQNDRIIVITESMVIGQFQVNYFIFSTENLGPLLGRQILYYSAFSVL